MPAIMGLTARLVLVSVLLLCEAGLTAERIPVPNDRDTTYLTYRLSVLREGKRGALAKEQRHPVRVYEPHRLGGPEGAVVCAYNPALNIDNPAIFSFYTYPSWIIDDSPVRLIVNDWQLYDDKNTGHRTIAAAGYKRDSAWAFCFDPVTEKYDRVFLCRGSDATGDGVWDPNISVLLVNDYDWDGYNEAFFYVNSMREKTPRELFCVEMESLRVEWSLPVASSLNDRWFYCIGDSLNPAVMFASYNPKHGITDSCFDDRWGYLTVVDRKGKVVYNRIVASRHGGMYLIPAESADRFYLAHETDLVEPSGFSGEISPFYHLSKINSRGEVSARADLTEAVRDLWLMRQPSGGPPRLYVHLVGQRLQVYDTALVLLAESDPTRLGEYLGVLTLAGYDDSVWVFADGLYSRNLEQLLVFPFMCNYCGALALDSDGKAVNLAIGTGNRYATGGVIKRSWLSLLSIFLVRHQSYVLIVLLVFVLALVTVNSLRQRAARRLIESERQLSSVLENVQDGFYRTDLDGNILWFSASVLRILGCASTDELAGRNVREFYADPAKRDDFVRKMSEQGRVTDYEIEVQHGDGSRVFVSSSAGFFQDSAGRTAGIEGILRDMTERKKVEQALSESEARYRQLVEGAGESIFTLDRNGRVLFANSVAIDRIGGSPENIMDKTVEEIMLCRAVGIDTERLRRVFTGGQREIIETTVDLSGEPCRYRTSMQPIRNAYGEMTSVLCIAQDITESWQARRQLDEERSFVRSLLETANSLVVCLDAHASITIFNREMEKVTGYSREEVLGKSWPDIFLPSDHRRHAIDNFAVWVRAHPQDVYEGPLVTKSGEIRTVLWSNTAVFTEDSDELTAIAVGQDITERKKAEMALKESEIRFKQVLDHSLDILYRLNLNSGRYDYVSASVEQIIGYKPEELLYLKRETLRSLMHPDDRRQNGDYRERLGRSATGEPSSLIAEYRFRCKDGSYHWLSDSCALICDSTGQPEFVIGSVRDITPQKEAQQALEISEQRYTLATAAANVGVWDWNLKTGEFYLDPILKENLGYQNDEIPKNLEAWINCAHPDDREFVMKAAREYLEGRSPEFRCEYRMVHKDGSIRWILVQGMVIRNDEGEAVRMIGTDTDITGRKLAEAKALESQRERYRQAKQIAGGFAHEIRNALFPAEAAILRLKQMTAATAEPAAVGDRYIETADEAIARAIETTELISLYTRLDSEYLPESVTLRDVIREVVEANRIRIEDQNVKVEVNFDTDAIVESNRQQIFMVFNNLLLNSLDALTARPEATIIINVESNAVWVTLSHFDNGCGISEDDQPKVFDTFFSLKPNRGTGLGLSMARKIVEMYGGDIRVESEYGKWTRFYVRFRAVVRMNGQKSDGGLV